MHNGHVPLDVNRDYRILQIDVLLVINHLNRLDWNPLFRQDVNNDGVVTPLDVLLIINHLNRQLLGDAEGESTLGLVASVEVKILSGELNHKQSASKTTELDVEDVLRVAC